MDHGVGFNQLSQLVGGVVLFLFGLRLASDNLKAVSGSRLRGVMKLLTANRFLGLLAGILGTILVQSNTATSVVVVGMCQAGILNLARSVGVLLGANLGSTVTIQMVAFDLYAYALLLIAVGFVGTIKAGDRSLRVAAVSLAGLGGILVEEGQGGMGLFLLLVAAGIGALSFAAERRALGSALMGFGLIFVGLKIVGLGMEGLRQSPAFVSAVVDFQQYPILVILCSFVFTVLTNSSTATLGTAIALTSAGPTGQPLLCPQGALAIVMGAHLGSIPMTVLSSLGGGRLARQVALVHVFIKVAGVVLIYPAVAHFAQWFTELNVWFGAGPARCVANAHTFFNLLNVFTVLPFAPQVARLIERALPEQTKKVDGILQHISEEQMEYHPMAIESAELEVKRVAFLVRKLMRSMEPALQTEDSAELWKLKEADDEIDTVFASVLAFLTRLGQERLGTEVFQRLMTMVYVLTHLEGIGDCVSKDYYLIMKKRMERDVEFSMEGIASLSAIHALLVERMDAIIKILGERDASHVARVLEGKEEFEARTRTLTKSHFKQLVKGVQAAEETTMMYLDTLAVFKNIHRALVDIVQNLYYCPYYGGPAGQQADARVEPASPPVNANGGAAHGTNDGTNGAAPPPPEKAGTA